MNITKESAREKIRILVDRFAEHVEEYNSLKHSDGILITSRALLKHTEK